MIPRRLWIAVNPHSGGGRGPSILRSLMPIFEAADVALTIHETRHAGHAADLVRQLDTSELDAFCVVGGDGTMHEAVNGLLSRPDKPALPLAMIPAGSGNAFLHGFDCLDPVDAARRIVAGKARAIDAAHVSLGDQTIYAFNIVGWGLVADILATSEKLRWLGETRYTLASALAVLKGRRRRARLIFDGRDSIDRFSFILGCNTPYTGKGMRMAPRADVSDGLIDLIIVRAAPRLKILRLLPKVFDGSHVNSPLLEYVQTAEFSIIPEKDERNNIDGELTAAGPLHVKMMPRAFQMLI